KDLSLVIDSAADNTQPHPGFNPGERKPDILQGTGSLKKPVIYDNAEFTHVKHISKYPYVIMVGYNSHLAESLFAKIVLSRMVEFLGIGIAALIMLYAMRQRLVKPVMQLSSVAKNLSQGKKISIPKSPIY